MREPMFTETMQVSLVVHDLDAAVRAYVHEYGIGPWEIHELNPDTVAEMTWPAGHTQEPDAVHP